MKHFKPQELAFDFKIPDGPLAGLSLGAYDFIMADPPWNFKNWSEKGETKNASQHYDCMSLEQISALPVSLLSAKNCILWLWVTNPMLPQGLETMKAWGFEYSTHGVWAKKTVNDKQAFGFGYRLRTAHETFLIGTRGNPKSSRSIRSLFEGKIRQHSRKPERAYREAERMMPDARRLDLFSRQRRPGWTGFGFELDKFGSHH